MSPVYIQGIEQVVAHAAKHQDTGADEVSVAALSGELADRQKSKTGDSTLGWTDQKLKKGAGAGADPTEIDVPSAPPPIVKTADEIVNNSGTLQNDDELKFAMAANEIWLVEVYLEMISASTTPGITFGWAYPTNCTILWGYTAVQPTETSTHPGLMSPAQAAKAAYIETQAPNLTTGTSTVLGRIWAIVKNGSTAGNLNLKWAQVNATAEDTKVLANSCIIRHQLV